MITFEPFWNTIKEKGINQYSLIHNYGISTGTLDSIRKNRSITLNTLNDLCQKINCDVQDIIRYVPEENNTKKK